MQLNYSYQKQIGIAGGLYDVSPHSVNSRTFVPLDDSPVPLKFGMGVVVDSESPGRKVTLPTENSTAADFEGLILTGHISEQNMQGEIAIKPSETVGVLRFGKAYARIEPNIEPKYGDKVYLITSGDFVGYFTNVAANAIPIKAQFLGNSSSNIAPIEIFNQQQE
ncbi:MAG: hypothetical protein FWG64_09180 [Firmicutes bacterium]|nr:hypothetical protein [Bacillota bacterium]